MIYDEGNPVAKDPNSKSFINDLRREAFNNNDFLKGDDVKEAIAMLSAIAEFDGEADLDIYKRVAPLENGGIEIDVCDNDGTRIRVENGEVFEITSGSECIFQRMENSLALPSVAEEGDFTILEKYVRLTDIDFYLLIGWMTYTLATPKHKHAGFPILVIIASPGAGKSFFCKTILRTFVDPVTNPIGIFPKTVNDMAISRQNAHLLIYDNIREFDSNWSDHLCNAATGGAISGRALYTNAQEFTLSLLGPTVLNSIHPLIKEGDCATRTLTFQLEPMPEEERKDEMTLSKEIMAEKSIIFTGLLKLIADVLAVIGDVDVSHAARMMQFSRWLTAMEICLALEPGVLQKAYLDNINTSMLEALIEDPLSNAVLEFAAKHKEPDLWVGTPSRLLQALSEGQSGLPRLC